MDLSEIIKNKKEFIEQKTGSRVIFEKSNDIWTTILIDFPKWNNNLIELPKILYQENVRDVDKLHELVHLEKFFIDQYPIIACNNTNLYPILDLFKNIPEDYMAHKVIKEEYGLNPIEKNWFGRLSKLNTSELDEKIAYDLVSAWSFLDFCPEYKEVVNSFDKKCKRQKIKSWLIAKEAIKFLKELNYQSMSSYKKSAENIIRIFAPIYYVHKEVFLCRFFKGEDVWKWIPE